MGQIKVEENAGGISGLRIITPTVHEDGRGYFCEVYNLRDMREAGMDMSFVQDNQSRSVKGVLRGLHYQKRFPQGKLVRVMQGSVFDVAVDLRPGSPTFTRWFGIELSGENKKQFYIPEGFAHGYLVLSDEAEFMYKVTDFWHPNDEGGLLWNDPDIAVAWPTEGIASVLLSNKDKDNPSFRELKESGFFESNFSDERFNCKG